MRVSFSDVFSVLPNGMFTPKTTVQIGGVTMSPGVSFGAGVSFGGVDLSAIQGRDLEVEHQGAKIVIRGHY